ncbi:hypothetical protein PJM27_19530 [Mycobacterium kansasii]
MEQSKPTPQPETPAETAETGVPLAWLAAELGATIGAVERQIQHDFYPEAVWRDPNTGMRCVAPEISHTVITEQLAREAAQREREQRRREEIAAQNAVPQTRERLRKLGEAQARQQGGLLRPETAQ